MPTEDHDQTRTALAEVADRLNQAQATCVRDGASPTCDLINEAHQVVERARAGLPTPTSAPGGAAATTPTGPAVWRCTS